MDMAAVCTSARALTCLLADAALAGLPADALLDGIEIGLPVTSREALLTFFEEEQMALREELSSSITLPSYCGLEWRLQVQLGGKYTLLQSPKPSFLVQLCTWHGPAANTEHVLQADVSILRRLASELEAALAEEKSTHSRRLGRRLGR